MSERIRSIFEMDRQGSRERMRKNSGPFTQITCAVCGKKFVKQPGSIYHFQFADRSLQFCSYTCYNIGLKVKAETNESEYVKFRNELKDKGE